MIRTTNLLIIGFTQLMVYIFLRDDTSGFDWFENAFFLFLIATLLISAAGYIINDYFDIKIDAINKPSRLVVGKMLSPRIAMIVHLFMNVIAIGIAFWLNLHLGIMFMIIGFLLWQYSVSFKRAFLAGNLVIAFLMGLTLLSVYVFDPRLSLHWTVFYAFFAFLTGLIREIVKDVEDMEGDEAFNCRTYPLVKGFRATHKLLKRLVIFLIIVLITTFIWFLFEFFFVSAGYFLLFLIIPAIVFLNKLNQADKKRDFGLLSTYIKLIMFSGIFSMIFKGV